MPAAHGAPDAALLLPSFHGGGFERVMLNIADGLAVQGLAADLVVAWPEGSYADQVPRGVRVVPLEAPRMLRAMPSLVAYLRRERPRSLLAGLEHANVLAIWARRLARVPTRVVVSSHKDFTLSVARSPLRRERWLLPTAVRLSYPMAEAVVSVSGDLADDLARVARIPRSRITVIHNPIVTEELLAAARAPVEHPWFARGRAAGAARGGPADGAEGLPDAAAGVPGGARAAGAAPGGARRGRGAGAPGGARARARRRLRGGLRGLRRQPVRVHGQGVAVRALVRVGGPADGHGRGDGVRDAGGLDRLPERPGEILEGGRYGRLVAVGDAGALAGAMLATLDDPPPPELLRERAGDFGTDQAIERYRAVLEV